LKADQETICWLTFFLYSSLRRVLELASHGRTDEILIYFRNATGTFTLGRINYHLADNKWHNLAVTLHSLSGLVTFRLDCTVVHQAPLTPDMLDILRWRDLSLWLGQRNSNSVHNRELLKASHAAPILHINLHARYSTLEILPPETEFVISSICPRIFGKTSE
jgi:hypothetical protein